MVVIYLDSICNKGQTDSWELAKLVCFYYELCDVRDAIKSLIIDALTIYQGDDSWELKIKLINKCNVTSGGRPQNLLLGPGPKTKSQGTGLKKNSHYRTQRWLKASLDIGRAVPYLFWQSGKIVNLALILMLFEK